MERTNRINTFVVHCLFARCLRIKFCLSLNILVSSLRNSELNYYVPRPRTESAKGSLHYRGSVLWNRIPLEIRKLPSLNVFKT